MCDLDIDRDFDFSKAPVSYLELLTPPRLKIRGSRNDERMCGEMTSQHFKQTISVPSMGKLDFNEVNLPKNTFIIISEFKISGIGVKINKKMKKESYRNTEMIPMLYSKNDVKLSQQYEGDYDVEIDEFNEASGTINLQLDMYGNYSIFSKSSCGTVTSIDIECNLEFVSKTTPITTTTKSENVCEYNDLFKLFAVITPDIASTDSSEKAVQYKDLIDFIDKTVELSKNGYKRSSFGSFHSDKHKQTVYYSIMEKEM